MEKLSKSVPYFEISVGFKYAAIPQIHNNQFIKRVLNARKEKKKQCSKCIVRTTVTFHVKNTETRNTIVPIQRFLYHLLV